MQYEPSYDLAHASGAKLAPLERVLPQDWPETWRSIARALYVAMVGKHGAGISPEACAIEQMQALAQNLGGQNLYIQRGQKVASAALATTLRSQFRGNNYRELAARHNLSEMRVRQILDGRRGGRP